MWAKCISGRSGALCNWGTSQSYDWPGALELAASSSLAGYEDWRIPNIKELLSIIEERCTLPTLNRDAAVFPNAPASVVWTSTPSLLSPTDSMVVSFDYGYSTIYYRFYEIHVRLVRGPE